jgi:hypothetical protein
MRICQYIPKPVKQIRLCSSNGSGLVYAGVLYCLGRISWALYYSLEQSYDYKPWYAPSLVASSMPCRCALRGFEFLMFGISFLTKLELSRNIAVMCSGLSVQVRSLS